MTSNDDAAGARALAEAREMLRRVLPETVPILEGIAADEIATPAERLEARRLLARWRLSQPPADEVP